MAATSVRTIYMAAVELCRSLDIPYSPLASSTWNEYLNIQKGATGATGAVPKLNLLMIGRGGHNNVTGADGEPLIDPLQHKIVNAVLKKPIPFIMREVGEDLTTTRANYRLRRLETHSGVQYFAYYAKVISFSGSSPSYQVLTIDPDTGETTPATYEPDAAVQLSPTFVAIVNGKIANQTTNKYISVGVPVSIVLTKTDCTEIINACSIIYNDERYAQITEIAVSFGIDKVVDTTDGGVTATYTETVLAGTGNFITSDINLNVTSKEVSLDYRLASTLPYYE